MADALEQGTMVISPHILFVTGFPPSFSRWRNKETRIPNAALEWLKWNQTHCSVALDLQPIARVWPSVTPWLVFHSDTTASSKAFLTCKVIGILSTMLQRTAWWLPGHKQLPSLPLSPPAFYAQKWKGNRKKGVGVKGLHASRDDLASSVFLCPQRQSHLCIPFASYVFAMVV